MVELSTYLISLFCIMLGMMGLIAALKIEGWVRMLVACCAALIPVAAGMFLFWSAELSLSDFRPADQKRNSGRPSQQVQTSCCSTTWPFPIFKRRFVSGTPSGAVGKEPNLSSKCPGG